MLKLSNSNVFNIALFLFTSILVLIIPFDNALWASFSDSYDYLYQSKIPLTHWEFYIPNKVSGFYPRPFTTPLLYKICGSEPDRIIIAQKLIHSLSTFFLAYALLQFIKAPVLKFLWLIGLYALMSWWNIVGWTIILLSESLSMSLLFCWLASFLLFLKEKTGPYLLLHILLTLLFSFTRDTWPYILIAFYGLTTVLFYIEQKELLKKTVVLFVFSCLLFFTQQYTSENGKRHRLPITNSIIMRIIPNQEYMQWFIEHEMPCSDSLGKNFSHINFHDASKLAVYALYNDTTYNEFHHWAMHEGKNTYMKFLITHPSFFFLLEEKGADLQNILAYNLFYAGPPRGYTNFIESYLPLFNIWTVLLLSLFLILIFSWKRKIILLIPVVLAIVFFLNVLLSYNADAFEVDRHLFITTIMIQLIGLIAVILVLDNYPSKEEEHSE
ncbi:MAG: hypothetical protein JWO58_1473 [Chitinophagaceae bacterium]|nr:hypothetical protein [Chitinophagaceae bacterium]